MIFLLRRYIYFSSMIITFLAPYIFFFQKIEISKQSIINRIDTSTDKTSYWECKFLSTSYKHIYFISLIKLQNVFDIMTS